MQEKDIPQLKDIKQLVESLGFKLVKEKDPNKYCSTDMAVFMRSKKTGDIVVRCGIWPKFRYDTWTDYGSLANDLLLVKEFAVFPNDSRAMYVDNPYYGCRSLEEAMIRKDLIANGN